MSELVEANDRRLDSRHDADTAEDAALGRRRESIIVLGLGEGVMREDLGELRGGVGAR